MTDAMTIENLIEELDELKDEFPFHSMAGITGITAQRVREFFKLGVLSALAKIKANRVALEAGTEHFPLPTEPDWDSYGALPPTQEARNTLDALWVVPMNNGGVQIELHVGGKDIELEINPDGSIGDFTVKPDTAGINQPYRDLLYLASIYGIIVREQPRDNKWYWYQSRLGGTMNGPYDTPEEAISDAKEQADAW